MKVIWDYKVSTFLGLLAIACLPVYAIPAYSQINQNTLDYSPDSQRTPPQTEITQGHRAPTNNGNKRTFQSVVRRHMAELDKQTQTDLKILSYLETELNQIFSCYIRLSCPRIRSAKVLEECDELKEWPLYHQVMKMAGIRKYPYQNYAPQTRGSSPVVSVTTSAPSITYTQSVGHLEHLGESAAIPVGVPKNSFDADGKPEYNEQSYFHQDRRNSRRVRRGHKHHHHHNGLQTEE